MQDLIKLQRSFFNSNATKPLAFRIAQLKKFEALLKANEKEMYAAIYLDYGKLDFETFLTEFYVIFDELKSAIQNIEKWAAVKPVKTNLLNSPAKSYIMPEPLGVSLIIGPWNYPYQLSLGPVVAAMAAGCTIVLKPSELTANSSCLIAKLINDAFDKEYFYVVEGGIPETTSLLEQKFDMIFFTGSVPVGKIVYQAAAKHLTPVILELGGKSPVIIMPDCDLVITVQRLIWAKFLNSGQTCIAPDYVLVHESIKDAFLLQVSKEIESADYSLKNGNYVKIINERNASRVAAMIDKDKVYIGGYSNISNRFIEPTVMHNVTWQDKVMQDEIFGPLLPVMGFTELDTIIAEIKDRPKPLSLYLFTKDEATKAKVLSEISFGGGCVNEALMHISNGELPFGGVGDSGIGSYHGEPGFSAFSHYKSILDKELVQDPPIKYSPHTEEKLAILKSVV